MAIVEMKDVSRVYTSGDHECRALDHVNLSLEEGKFIVILGPSGAGKSTLLNLLGGLDSPTGGSIVVDGRDISGLTRDELAEYRAAKVGFVFQFYNLVPTLTVHENVTLVKEIAPEALSATQMLERVGLSDHLKNFPAELSGGEQQRVSIARALAKNLGPCLLPQAGVAIGLSLAAGQVVPQHAPQIRAVILCGTLIYELIGPAVTKFSLKKAGEITGQ